MKKFIYCVGLLLISFVSSLLVSCSKDDIPKEIIKEAKYDYLINGIAYNIISLDDLTLGVTASTDPNTYTGAITIPSTINIGGKDFTVIEIGDKAFEYSSITNISLPNTILRIESSAFRYCEMLSYINLPKSLLFVGTDVFEAAGLESFSIPSNVEVFYSSLYCSNLKNLVIENSEKELELSGDLNYSYSSIETIYQGRNLSSSLYANLSTEQILKSYTIGKDVTNISLYFRVPHTIICESETPIQGKIDCEDIVYIESTLYVPSNSVELYKEDSLWGKFWNIKAI